MIPSRSYKATSLPRPARSAVIFEVMPLLVLSPDDGHEVQHEGRVHGAERLS
jgi:hypothetical protein